MTLISNQIVDRASDALVLMAPSPICIIDETAADICAREALLDEAFGLARFAKTAQRLRDGRMPAPDLAIAAKDGDELVGTLRLWPIEAGNVPALLLGPLAVAKTHRSRGLGRRLTAEALFRAFAAGYKAVLLVGDASYYEPFGFSRRHTLDLVLPGPVDESRFLGLELERGALKDAKGLVRGAGALDLSALQAEPEFRYAA